LGCRPEIDEEARRDESGSPEACAAVDEYASSGLQKFSHARRRFAPSEIELMSRNTAIGDWRKFPW
jgi:hypothetical protein